MPKYTCSQCGKPMKVDRKREAALMKKSTTFSTDEYRIMTCKLCSKQGGFSIVKVKP